MYKKYIKRLLDIIFSFILIILLWPLMLVVAIITLIDLGLPLHNEIREREGLNKKTFIMYKFRTKKLQAEHLKQENRYTKTSLKIDKYRLNELPQLFNVLKGDMSLVGPRPFIPGDKLPGGVEISPKRYMVRPGMTGLAQVNGCRLLTHADKLKYDVIYYDNLSFKTDLKTVIKTILKILKLERDK